MKRASLFSPHEKKLNFYSAAAAWRTTQIWLYFAVACSLSNSKRRWGDDRSRRFAALTHHIPRYPTTLAFHVYFALYGSCNRAHQSMELRQLLKPFANSVSVKMVASLSALRLEALLQEPIAVAPTHRLSHHSFASSPSPAVSCVLNAMCRLPP